MGFRDFVQARKARETAEISEKASRMGCALGASCASDDVGAADFADGGSRLARNFDVERGRLAGRCYWRVVFKPRVAIRERPSVDAPLVGGADFDALVASRDAAAATTRRGRKLKGTWIKAADSRGWICCDPTGTKVAHLGPLLERAPPGAAPAATASSAVDVSAPAPFAGAGVVVTRTRERYAWRGGDAPRVKAGFRAVAEDGRVAVGESRCVVVVLAGPGAAEDLAVSLVAACENVAACLLRAAGPRARAPSPGAWRPVVDTIADHVVAALPEPGDLWREATARGWRDPAHVVFAAAEPAYAAAALDAAADYASGAAAVGVGCWFARGLPGADDGAFAAAVARARAVAEDPRAAPLRCLARGGGGVAGVPTATTDFGAASRRRAAGLEELWVTARWLFLRGPRLAPPPLRVSLAQVVNRHGDGTKLRGAGDEPDGVAPPPPLQLRLDELEASVREAKARGSVLHLFPECFLPGYGYVHQAPDQLARLARSRQWLEARVGAIARRHGVDVAVGYAERANDGALHNAAAVVSGDSGRVVLHHRKRRLVGGEHKCFAAAPEAPAAGEPRWRARLRRESARRAEKAREKKREREAAADPDLPPPPPPSGEAEEEEGEDLRPLHASAASGERLELATIRGYAAGLVICADAEEDDFAADLAARGATLLIVLAAAASTDPDWEPKSGKRSATSHAPAISHWLNATTAAVRHGLFVAYCNLAAPEYGGSRVVAPDGRDAAGPPLPPRRGAADLRSRWGGAYDDGAHDARDDDGASDDDGHPGDDDARATLVGDVSFSLRHQLDWRRSNRVAWHMHRSNHDSDEEGGD